MSLEIFQRCVCRILQHTFGFAHCLGIVKKLRAKRALQTIDPKVSSLAICSNIPNLYLRVASIRQSYTKSLGYYCSR